MFGSAFNTALSGLSAASTKFAVSAKNIANAQSTTKFQDGQIVDEPYEPEIVVQSTTSTGSVITQTQKAGLDPVVIYDPSHPSADANGLVNFPNISIEAEFVDQIIAKNEFLANLQVIKSAEETQESIFDILS